MIDDPAKTLLLIARLSAELPFEAIISKGLVRLLKEQRVPLPGSVRVHVTDIKYLGDPGGITCKINGAFEQCHWTSLTHLILPRKLDCYRDAVRYQKNRVKRQRREVGYGPTLLKT